MKKILPFFDKSLVIVDKIVYNQYVMLSIIIRRFL